MKKAEEYYNETEFPEKWKIIRAIKQAQIDAIEEAVKLCAENAVVRVNCGDYETFCYTNYENDDVIHVSEESILNCAEILKQQL